jgi:hypothetical protein
MSEAERAHDLSARAARFARRIAGDAEPAFADWQRLRQIDRMVAGRRDAIAELVALLDARAAIDSELNGSRLGALVARVGEAQFDSVCDAVLAPVPLGRGRAALPDPHLLMPLGEALMQSLKRSADALHLARIAVDIDAACTRTQAAA